MDIAIWEESKIPEIKQMYGKDLTESEFAMFLNLGKSLNANPFTREIFAVKYGNASANIFCGRDFYRRKAQEQLDYDGLQSSAVYENDNFEVENGIPKHKFGLKNRGKLIGAYAVVYRKNIKQPYFVFVDFLEYYQGYKKPDGAIKKRKDQYGNWVETKPTVWDEKGATMICKVAEAQTLRGAYQGIFKGTYDESEQWKTAEKEVNQAPVKEIEVQKPEPVQEQKQETQTVFQSGESTFEIIEPQPIIEQAKKEKKPKFTPAKILETLEAEIYTSRMSEDALLALDQLKERWEKKRDTLVQAGVFDLGLQKIKTTIKELKNES
jgi:phage recombination protein Bet